MSLPAPYQQIVLTKYVGQKKHWLIGPHPQLSSLATDLRSNRYLGDLLAERGVRFGLKISLSWPSGGQPGHRWSKGGSNE